MKYCKRCLYPENHPLNLILDDEGVCSGCRVHEEKDALNWTEREKELERIVEAYRGRPGTHFDCIIPVSGNGDSFWVVDRVKNKYGLNPLLVTYNTQFNTKVGIRNLSRLITKLDCDHLNYTVGPETARRVTRISLHTMGDMYWHVLAGSQTFPVQVATKLNIPLIIWGVHGWLDQVGMFSHLDLVEMTKKVRKEHGLRGHDAEDLLGHDPNVTAKDLQAFTYPSDKQLEESRVRGLYLGNFVRWDAQAQTEEMIKKYGYETSAEERTFNTYETIGCWNNAGVHDWVKYLKYGYGKATDHASRDIRLKRMTREDGAKLARQYDPIRPSGLPLFLDWLGMTESEFMACVDKFRDPRAWKKDAKGEWQLLDSVDRHLGDTGVEKVALQATDRRAYVKTPLLEPQETAKDPGAHYILMGRLYSDEIDFKAEEG